MSKQPPKLKGLTKSEIASNLAEKAGLTKAQVTKLFDAMAELANKELHRAGNFTVPNMVKIQAKHKAATAARQGRNPKTGESLTISAKPAKTVLRGRVLTGLKSTW